MQNPLRLPGLFHGNEEVSVGVDGACVPVYGCSREGWGEKCWQTEFLHLKCHLEITCVLQAQAPNSSPAIKNGLQNRSVCCKKSL